MASEKDSQEGGNRKCFPDPTSILVILVVSEWFYLEKSVVAALFPNFYEAFWSPPKRKGFVFKTTCFFWCNFLITRWFQSKMCVFIKVFIFIFLFEFHSLQLGEDEVHVYFFFQFLHFYLYRSICIYIYTHSYTYFF